MGYISKCEHGTPMALCRKCFPDVSEHNDWSNYKYTHPVKELTDEEITGAVARGWCSENNSMKVVDSDLVLAIVEEIRAILRKAQPTCNGFCGEYECKENQAGCKRKAQEK